MTGELKIALTDAVKIKDVDKVFGLTPVDYKIYKLLGKIDKYGNQKISAPPDDEEEDENNISKTSKKD